MILPTATTVAVADGETVRLFHNTGVKPGVHLVEITAAPPALAHSAPSHRLCQPRWQAVRRGRLRGSDGRVPEQAQPGRAPFVVFDPRTLGEIHKHFHRDLRGKIIGELAKDFSRRPLTPIRADKSAEKRAALKLAFDKESGQGRSQQGIRHLLPTAPPVAGSPTRPALPGCGRIHPIYDCSITR